MRHSVTKYLTTLLCFGLVGGAFAGPPVDMWAPGELWLAAEYASSHRPVPGGDEFNTETSTLPTQSNRVILKGGYQVYQFVDVFALLGFADLRVGADDPTFNDYNGEMSLAYGGGLQFGYLYSPYNIGSSLTTTVMGFTNRAEVSNQLRRVVNRYNWYEIQLEWTASYPLESITPFLGLEKTYLTGSHEVDDYFLGRLQPGPTGSNAYSDPGQSWRPLAGFALHLPGEYSAYLKISGMSSDDFLFTVGISQGSKSSKR